MSGMVGIAQAAILEMQERSRKRIYQTDIEAWCWDILGRKHYSKQIEINQSVLENTRTAVKSANGCGKSADIADLVTWWCSVFPPEETLAIMSAPTISQIEKVLMAYLKANHASAKVLGTPLIGEISEELTWKFPNAVTGKKDFLAFGKRPSDSDIVSSFQGTRKLRTMVALDEAGGVPTDLFTAAEAVATGEYSRIIAIGNPDRRGTQFHQLWTNPDLSQDWNLQSISAFDLPTFTGEKTYDDPIIEDKFLKSLTSVAWVEHKRRAWGETDARWLSKVMGEFPGEADNTFFGQHVIDKAYASPIEEDLDVPAVIGVDVARWGDDESVLYVNRGGRVRLHPDGVWGKADTVDSARRIHRIATDIGAVEVRIDSAGIGGAIYDMLAVLPEFAERMYSLIGIDGGTKSPDLSQWSNNRSYNHDSLRSQMLAGTIDLDYDDRQLRDELMTITYKFSQRGGIQITPKDEMRVALGGSPDRLDALIYATTDLSWLTDSPFAGMQKGDKVVIDPEDWGVEWAVDAIGMPI